MLPDLVVPVRPGRYQDPESLRYALRTWDYHLPHRRVFIVGHLPSWANLDEVTHIPSEQREQRFLNVSEPQLKFVNQRANLEAVMGCQELGEHFLWMSDDFFALRDVQDIPYYHRGSLKNYLDGLGDGEYAEGLRFCLKLMASWYGLDDVDNYAVHAPLPIEKSRLISVMTEAWADGLQGGFMRAIYPVGAIGWHEGPVVDPKLKGKDALPELDWTWVSTDSGSWSGNTGALIRNRYWRASIYEQ